MKAYIHTVGGKPFNDECEIAMRGFQKLGVECIQFSSNDVLAPPYLYLRSCICTNFHRSCSTAIQHSC